MEAGDGDPRAGEERPAPSGSVTQPRSAAGGVHAGGALSPHRDSCLPVS